jgi:hypothetical protein
MEKHQQREEGGRGQQGGESGESGRGRVARGFLKEKIVFFKIFLVFMNN